MLHVSAYSDTADVIMVANTFEELYDSTLTISTTTDWYWWSSHGNRFGRWSRRHRVFHGHSRSGQ